MQRRIVIWGGGKKKYNLDLMRGRLTDICASPHDLIDAGKKEDGCVSGAVVVGYYGGKI